MDKKKLTSLKNRIKRDMASFGCMGALLLDFEFDAMTNDERKELVAFLASGKNPISYPPLNLKIQ